MEERNPLPLWLLLPVNAIILASGLAIAQGAIALPPPPSLLGAAAPATPTRSAPTPVTQPAPVAGSPGTVAARLAPRPAPAPTSTPQPAPRRRRAATPREPQPAFEQEVRRQVRRIPLYRPGVARWLVVEDLAAYGITSLRTSTVYLSPRIPRRLLYSVVAHEWGHVISTRAYNGDLVASQRAFKRWFGGSTRTALERVADCIALVLGATWTYYTSCADQRWRHGARSLAAGRPLPSR